VTQQSPATSPANKEPVAPATNVVSTPATVLAPSTVDSSKAVASEGFNPQTLLFAVLLGAGILILLWVGYTEFRRRVSVSAYSPAPATGPDFDSFETETTVEKLAAPKRLAGGPPQVSLHLKASEPSVRRAAVPFSKPNRPFGTNGGVTTVGPVVESFVPRAPAPAPAPVVERIEKPIVEPITDVTPEPEKPAFVEPVFEPAEEADEFSSVGEPQVIEEPARAVEAIPAIEEMPAAREELVITEAPFFAETPAWTQPAAPEPEPVWAPITQEPAWTPVAFEPSAPVFETPAPVFETPEPIFEAPAPEPVAETEALFESVSEPVVIEPEAAPEPIAEFSPVTEEPVAQGPPIPYQVPAFETDSPMAEITKPEPEELPAHLAKGVVAGTSMAGVGALRHSVESPSFAPKVISTEPLAQQPTTPATMPQPNQPTPAPSIRPSPMAGGAPQMQTSGMQAPAPSGMQTAVQLTFSFEIASLQLTPSFKMGALQLKPTSKIVTMRLAPSQQPQPAMNLQVTFEIATVQAAGGGIGQIRLTPSQQQRPSVISSPAFNIAGLQLLSGSESGAVQLTPSQQGQASVHVTGRFQIATVEFSPSFEISSLVLNATSKSVSVQLPGAGPSAVEGAPVFDIANVQITGNGEIGMMQLNAHGAAPKAA
jgi:hypothetical protein